MGRRTLTGISIGALGVVIGALLGADAPALLVLAATAIAVLVTARERPRSEQPRTHSDPPALVDYGQEILSALADGALLIRNDRVVFGNAAASQLLGMPVPESVDRLHPPALAEAVREAVSGATVSVTFELGVPRRWIEAVARRVTNGENQTVVLLHDVTSRRRVEAMRKDFVADASHELKTPVASIQATAETLVRALENDPEEAMRFAVQVRSSAARLSQIVSDLLDLSRLETKAVEFDTVRLDRLVAKEVRRMADRAEVEGVDLTVETEEIQLPGYDKDLRRAIRNLLENAIEFTAAEGKIHVTAKLIGDYAEVAVRDTGVGIPQKDLPRIFERFYRVDQARNRSTGGTGLGLAIVRHVAETHGGSVHVESELGRGSTFKFTLPIGWNAKVESSGPG